MKLRIIVEVEIDEAELNKEYDWTDDGGLDPETAKNFYEPHGNKAGEILAAYAGTLEKFPEETRRVFAQDALDRHHGLPGRCVKSWQIVENVIVDEGTKGP